MDNLALTKEHQTSSVLRSSLDPDSGLGLEIKLRKLGKIAEDVASSNPVSAANAVGIPIDTDAGEGNSVIEPFLARICPVMSSEISTRIQSLGAWRSSNLSKLCRFAANTLLHELSQMQLGVHPRVLDAVIEHGSLTEDPKLLKYWGNYLAASCTFDQDDERFISIARLECSNNTLTST